MFLHSNPFSYREILKRRFLPTAASWNFPLKKVNYLNYICKSKKIEIKFKIYIRFRIMGEISTIYH